MPNHVMFDIGDLITWDKAKYQRVPDEALGEGPFAIEKIEDIKRHEKCPLCGSSDLSKEHRDIYRKVQCTYDEWGRHPQLFIFHREGKDLVFGAAWFKKA